MNGSNKLIVNKSTMNKIVQYYLDNVLLREKESQQVEDVSQIVDNGYAKFDIRLGPKPKPPAKTVKA